MNWGMLVSIIVAAVLVWFGARFVRHNPQAFSRANLVKSIGTLGWLTIMIIAVIFVCVYFLKH